VVPSVECKLSCAENDPSAFKVKWEPSPAVWAQSYLPSKASKSTPTLTPAK